MHQFNFFELSVLTSGGLLLISGLHFHSLVEETLSLIIEIKQVSLIDFLFSNPTLALCIAWNTIRLLEHEKSVSPETIFWMVMTLSILSYPLTPLIPHGMNIALAIHIFLCIGGCIQICRNTGWNMYITSRFLLALLSCFVFVFLKLYDFELAKFWFFRRVTGMFTFSLIHTLSFSL
jgi:hypothetical protein